VATEGMPDKIVVTLKALPTGVMNEGEYCGGNGPRSDAQPGRLLESPRLDYGRAPLTGEASEGRATSQGSEDLGPVPCQVAASSDPGGPKPSPDNRVAAEGSGRPRREQISPPLSLLSDLHNP
jgi:hypothetical protein